MPTLMEAGMLSVAMTEGARGPWRCRDSINVTVPSNSRLLPTSMAAENVVVPPASAQAPQ